MKKLVLAAVVAAFGLASCKKDYTCYCSATSLAESERKHEYTNVTESSAKSSCRATQDDLRSYGYKDANCSVPGKN